MRKYAANIIYLLLSIFVVVLYMNDFGPVHRAQRSMNDWLCKVTASEDQSPNVAIVSIDARAQKQFGAWPWNYDRVADLVAATAGAEAKAIVLDFPLNENSAQDSAGNTRILAGQLSWAKQSVLQYDVALATYRTTKTSNPKFLFTNSIGVDNPLGELGDHSSLQCRRIFLPAEKLLDAGSKLGFDYDAPDDDGTLRGHSLFMHYEGYYYPSMALAAAAQFLNIPQDQIKIRDGEFIQLGSQRTIPIDHNGQYFIRFSDGNPFVTYSAADVLSNGFEFSHLKGKVVLIGPDAGDEQEIFRTSTYPTVPAIQVKATVIDNIINGRMIQIRDNVSSAQMLIMFLLGGIAAFVLPKVSSTFRQVVLLGGLVVLANVAFLMLSSMNTLTDFAFIGLELILFMIASPFIDAQMVTGEIAAPKADKHRTPKLSREDMNRPIPVRELKSRPTDAEYERTAVLGPDNSVQGPSDKTSANQPYDHQTLSADVDLSSDQGGGSDSGRVKGSAQPNPDWEDPSAINLPDDEQESAPRPSGPSPLSDSDRLGGMPLTEIKSLGRYQIIGTLGKGAMGLVYKGIDPAINRPVALKTIRLDFVNDPTEMEELRERLHREAQAAGKLSHPNIVTIYDVGSEGFLQYIAMEYLEGQTLEDMIKKKTKFNYKIIAQIITQICMALDYAHERGIVHRDIKPANIMVLKDYSVKVMDYGIARIDSNSMTKTGVAMGTPNYISPEQLRGLTIDRRADLFSLGVVMYEMLIGRRPFRGENITSLIYSILNNDPEKPSNINPQIPLLFDHVIMKALRKDPSERYQRASEVTNELAEFVTSFAPKPR